MSSTPFCLGLPVVDDLEPKNGSVVLRSKDEQELLMKLQKVLNELTQNDVVRMHPIGYRPNVPIPTTRYFAEVQISIGKAQSYEPSWIDLWCWTARGSQKQE